MHLTKIYAKNYRSIQEGALELSKNKTVLVGKNNAGKSNFLSILNIFFSGKYPTYYNFEESDFYDINSPIILRVSFSNNVEIGIKISYDQSSEKVKVDWDNVTGCQTNKEAIAQLCAFVYIPSDRNIDQHLRNNTYSWYGKLLQLILAYKKTKPEYISVINKLREIQIEFSRLLPTEDISKISRTLTYINKVSFGLSEGSKPEDLLKKVEILVDDGVGEKLLSKFGTGTQSTVILGLLELYLKVSQYSTSSQCKIFIIDEPENFLHPHAKRLLDNILHHISLQAQTQIIYSTHSSELISNFDNNEFQISDLRLVYKDGIKTQIKNIGNQENIIHELNSYNSEIFFADHIILVEGNTEKIMIPQIYLNNSRNETLFNSQIIALLEGLSGDDRINKIQQIFDINLHNISIITVDGKDSLPKRYEFCSSIVGKEKIHVILDRDIHLPTTEQVKLPKIIEVIEKIYGPIEDSITEKNLSNFNRYVLDGEFEYYYKQDIVGKILQEEIKIPEGMPIEKQKNRLDQETASLLKNLDTIYKDANKIKFSSGLESLINQYYHGYSKPGIAKLLGKKLIEKQGFKENLLKILIEIITKINNLYI